MFEFVLRFREMDFSAVSKEVAFGFLVDKAFRYGLTEDETKVAISTILG